MFPVTFRDDISRCVRGSESLCTLVPKRGQSSLNCRITVAETAVKKEFKIAKKKIKKKEGIVNPFSTISLLCINWNVSLRVHRVISTLFSFKNPGMNK